MSSMFNPNPAGVLRGFAEQEPSQVRSSQQSTIGNASDLFPNMVRNRDQLDQLWRHIARVLSEGIRQRSMTEMPSQEGLPAMGGAEAVPGGQASPQSMGSWERALVEQGLAPAPAGGGGMMPTEMPEGGMPAQLGDPGAGREGRMTAEEVAQTAFDAGFRGQALATMVAIAMAESSNDPRAHNPNAKTGDNSYGLWQINMLDREGYMMGQERREKYGIENEDLWDPDVNARVAFDLSRNGTKFTDWSVFRNNLHLRYWDVASRAAALVERTATEEVR